MEIARALVLVTAMASFGCPKSDEVCLGPRVSDDAVVPYDDLRAELCRYLERCRPESLDRFAEPTVEGCIAYERCTPSPPDHRVTEACVDALRAAPCESTADGLSPGYEVLFSDLCTIGGPFEQPGEGEECRVSICRPGGDVPDAYLYCADGLYCDRDDRCRPMIAVGEPCTLSRAPGVVPDPCETGSFCDFIAGICRLRLEPGAACEVLMDDRHTEDPCRFPASCEDGVCVRPPEPPPPVYASEGMPCDETDDCRRGLACLDGACAPFVCGGGPGDVCEPGTCSDGLVCHEVLNRCEPRGDACDDLSPDCPAGTYCADATLTCQSR